MNHIFKHILIAVGLFMHSHTMYAQTLNADTLVKYRVSKILTYELDSTGNKVLVKTKCINEFGKVFELYSYYKYFIDSENYVIHIDTVKYTYDSIGRVLYESKNNTSIHNITTTEVATKKSLITEFNYQKFFIVSPWSTKRIKHIHLTVNKETIKCYKNGFRTDHNKYFFRKGVEYSIEKNYNDYKPPTVPKNSCIKNPKRLYRNYKKWRKYAFIATYTRNSHGDIIEENGNSIFYYRKRFKKNVQDSYINTYEYTYENSFISSCKLFQNSTDEKKNKKNLLKNTIYEYITNPE